MSEQAANIHKTDMGSVTDALPELARALARHRPTHSQPHLISELIGMCKNYSANPVEVRKSMLKTMAKLAVYGTET